MHPPGASPSSEGSGRSGPADRTRAPAGTFDNRRRTAQGSRHTNNKTYARAPNSPLWRRLLGSQFVNRGGACHSSRDTCCRPREERGVPVVFDISGYRPAYPANLCDDGYIFNIHRIIHVSSCIAVRLRIHIPRAAAETSKQARKQESRATRRDGRASDDMLLMNHVLLTCLRASCMSLLFVR